MLMTLMLLADVVGQVPAPCGGIYNPCATYSVPAPEKEWPPERSADELAQNPQLHYRRGVHYTPEMVTATGGLLINAQLPPADDCILDRNGTACVSYEQVLCDRRIAAAVADEHTRMVPPLIAWIIAIIIGGAMFVGLFISRLDGIVGAWRRAEIGVPWRLIAVALPFAMFFGAMGFGYGVIQFVCLFLPTVHGASEGRDVATAAVMVVLSLVSIPFSCAFASDVWKMRARK